MPRKSKSTNVNPPPPSLYIIMQKENPEIVWAATIEPPDALMPDELCYSYTLADPYIPTTKE